MTQLLFNNCLSSRQNTFKILRSEEFRCGDWLASLREMRFNPQKIRFNSSVKVLNTFAKEKL